MQSSAYPVKIIKQYQLSLSCSVIKMCPVVCSEDGETFFIFSCSISGFQKLSVQPGHLKLKRTHITLDQRRKCT